MAAEEDFSDIFAGISEMLDENPVIPIALTWEEASHIRGFVEKGYTGDKREQTPLRRDMWDSALKLQEKILELQTKSKEGEKPPLIIDVLGTELTTLEDLAHSASVFGVDLSLQVDTIDALINARDSYNLGLTASQNPETDSSNT